MILGYYVRFNNGKYLNVDENKMVNKKKRASLFEDEWSAEYMADPFEIDYKLIKEEVN